MATKAEINAVYAAALIQGVALVTFRRRAPSSPIPASTDLSNTQYGMMFLPQVITAVTAGRGRSFRRGPAAVLGVRRVRGPVRACARR